MEERLLSRRQGPGRFGNALERFFKIRERGSTVGTELRAGLILFATMCYIVVVNPEILHDAGMDKGATACATCLAGMITTLLFGLFANLPFGAAPGMGLNTLFAYELVGQNELSTSEALACSFVAGCVFLLMGMTGLCTKIISHVPLSLKKAIVVGIGLLQTVVGLAGMELIRKGEYTILEAIPVTSPKQILSVSTLLLVAMLVLLEVPGSILIGIGISMIVAVVTGISPLPDRFFSLPYFHAGYFDFSIFATSKGYILSFLLFYVIFVDTGGAIVGIAAQGETLRDNSGDCVNSTRAYVCLGLGIIISACFGTSPMVIFLESAAAVNQGGRTGLTAVVAGVLLGLASFCVPLISVVPRVVTTPILVLVGSFMMGAVLAIPWDKINHSLPAYMTLTVTAFTCSICHGVGFGVSFWLVLWLPVFVARMTGWSWLADRVMIDDSQQTNLEKQTVAERQIERRTLAALQMQRTSDAGSLPSLTRIPSGSPPPEGVSPMRRQTSNVGWI